MSHQSPYLHPTYVDLSLLSHFNISATSTVTALAVRDLTLGDECEIANGICILAATQGNGTSFCSDFFWEEDMVKLCVGLGQANLETVL